MKISGVISARIFLALVSLLIVYLSHQPSLKPPVEWFPHQDKVFHLLEFGGLGLALVLNRDLFGGKLIRSRMIVTGVVWAIIDEIHQSFVPGRDSSIQDILADTTGLIIAILLFYRLFSRGTRTTPLTVTLAVSILLTSTCWLRLDSMVGCG